MRNRTGSPDAGPRRYRAAGNNSAATVNTEAATSIQAARSRGRAPLPVIAAAPGASSSGIVDASLISSRAIDASERRWRGSFVNARRSSRRTAVGVTAGRVLQSGSLLTTATIVSVTLPLSNARVPVSISNSTQPNAQMSVRLSTAWPRACSGLMYAAVPTTTPVTRAADRRWASGDARDSGASPSTAFARPKSSTLTTPSGRILMFAGFRSRWMMPCSCAASSASAICLAMGRASSSGDRPARDPLARASRLPPAPSRGPGGRRIPRARR